MQIEKVRDSSPCLRHHNSVLLHRSPAAKYGQWNSNVFSGRLEAERNSWPGSLWFENVPSSSSKANWRADVISLIHTKSKWKKWVVILHEVTCCNYLLATSGWPQWSPGILHLKWDKNVLSFRGSSGKQLASSTLSVLPKMSNHSFKILRKYHLMSIMGPPHCLIFCFEDRGNVSCVNMK